MLTKIGLVGPAGYRNTHIINQVAAFNSGRELDVEVTFVAIGDSVLGNRFDIIVVVPGVVLNDYDRRWLREIQFCLRPGGLLIGA